MLGVSILFPRHKYGYTANQQCLSCQKQFHQVLLLSPIFPPDPTGHGQPVSSQLQEHRIKLPIFLHTPGFPFTSVFSISMTKRPLLLNQSPSQEATQTRRNKICEVKSQGLASAFVKPSKISRVRWNRLCWLALFYGRRCTLAYRSHMGDSVDHQQNPLGFIRLRDHSHGLILLFYTFSAENQEHKKIPPLRRNVAVGSVI